MPASGNLAMANTRSTKVPRGWEQFYTALAGVTDQFCAGHLNDEYADLARSAIAALCRKRPSPDWLIRNRTQLANAIRGYAAEFGLTAAKGMATLVPLLERIQADENVPALARELFSFQAKEYAQLLAQIDEVDAKLMAWHHADECS